MRNTIRLTIFLIVSFTAFRMGQGCNESTVISQIDTVHVDRQIKVRDTINIYQPYRVTVYDTVETVRTDTIRVPTNFNYVGVIGSNPITLNRDGLTLTSFDVERQSFVQSVYEIPQRKWDFSLHTVNALTNADVRVAVELDIRYQKLTVVPTVGVNSTLGGNLGLFYGVRTRYRLY